MELNTTFNATEKADEAVTGWSYNMIPLDFEIFQKVVTSWAFVFPITTVIGVVGNSFSFAVLIRPSLRTLSTSIYIAGLMVSDTMLLISVTSLIWINRVVPSVGNLFHKYTVVCKLHNFTMQYFSSCSAWLIVAVSVDRFIAVTFPYQTSRLCTSYRAKVVTCALYVVLLGVWVSEFLVWGKVGEKCTVYPEYYTIMADYLVYFRMFIQSILPCVFIPSLSIGIIVSLVKQRMNPSLKHSASHQQSKRIRKISILVLANSLVYLVLSLPYHTQYVWMITTVDSRWLFDGYSAPEQVYLRIISYDLIMVGHSINLFVYVLSGQKFREEIKAMVCGNQKPAAVENSTKSTTNSG